MWLKLATRVGLAITRVMVVVAPLGSVEVPILVTNEGATEDTLPSARVVAIETGLENVDSGWIVDVIVAVVLGPS